MCPCPPPPPPKPEVTPDQPLVNQQPTVVPLPPKPLPAQGPMIDSTPIIPDNPTTDLIIRPIPIPQPGPSAAPTMAAFDPIPARPRNAPSRWATQDDYRSSWINRELTGTARFRLEIAADGAVRNCTITASSGHEELDRATCDLVSKRARFDPAKNDKGEKVTGSFSSAIRWNLPD